MQGFMRFEKLFGFKLEMLKKIRLGGSTKISAKPLSQKVWFMGLLKRLGLNSFLYTGCIN